MVEKIRLNATQLLSLYENTKNQFEQAGRQTELLNQYLVSLTRAKNSLKEISKNKNKGFYVDIGNQTFIPVKNTETKAKIDLGLGIYSETSFEQAINNLTKKQEQAEKAFKNMNQQLSFFGKKLLELEMQLQKLSKK